MKEIPLTQGYSAIIDDLDYDDVAQHKWQFHGHNNTPYASRTETVNGKAKKVMMHRQIMRPPSDKVVHHLNGNGLDCRRANMILCTQAENNITRPMPHDRDTGYKCIGWKHGAKRFVVQFTIEGKNLQFGEYDHIRDAVDRYNEVALELYGEFAVLQKVRTQGAALANVSGYKKTQKQGWSKSGERYIYHYEHTPGYAVTVRKDGRQIRVGTFKSLEAARIARDQAVSSLAQAL